MSSNHIYIYDVLEMPLLSLGPTFFLLSISCGMLLRPVWRKFRPVSGGYRIIRKMSSEEADNEYRDVLQNLFRAVKSTSRHKPSNPNQGGANAAAAKIVKTNEDLFAERSKFFNKIATDSNMITETTKIIHIAGSKGKGSVVEYLSTALRSTGERVGVFTSPHLHTARERVKINRSLISKEDLARIGKHSLRSMYNFQWTVFFDLFLATAIQYFGEQAVDYVIFETGIGGRYDSTNFVEAVDIGVITSISYDHTQILGETLELIAWQKAGIIKKRMHIFTPATQPEAALSVIQKQCKDVGATLHIVDINETQLKNLLPNIAGDHVLLYDVQIENACIAMEVVQHLQINPQKMFQDYFWPCRMEEFRLNQIQEIDEETGVDKIYNVSEVTVVLDGAHNGDSVELFLKGLRTKYPGREITVLFGAGLEKQLDDMLSQLQSSADSIVFLQSKHFKSASEQELETASKKAGFSLPISPLYSPPKDKIDGGTVYHRLQSAILHSAGIAEEARTRSPSKQGCDSTSEAPVIAVCGSLFASAEARECLYKFDPNLFKDWDWVRFQD